LWRIAEANAISQDQSGSGYSVGSRDTPICGPATELILDRRFFMTES